MGLWHGLILPISFLISLFGRDIGIYQVTNNGSWYDFGFLLGALFLGMLLFEGSGRIVFVPADEREEEREDYTDEDGEAP